MIRARVLAGLAAASLLLLSSCGSDAKVADAVTSTSVDPSGADPTSDTISDTIPPLPPGASKECANAYTIMTKAVRSTGGDLGGTLDYASALGQLKQGAPADVASALDTMATTLTRYGTAIGKYAGDAAKGLEDPEVQAALNELDGDAFQKASTTVDAYFTKLCPEFTGNT
jgi:hypothetical protein